MSRADACTVRDDHFHILVDARYVPRDSWPGQGRAGIGPDAWGDIKSNGFVPAPGCTHHTGHPYAPAGRPAVPATAGLMAALRADRASYVPPPGQGGTGGTGGGHDCDMMTAVMRWILEDCDKDECYERWLAKAGAEEDPARPFGDKDFDRHWRSASRYAGEILAREERTRQWTDAVLAWKAGGAR